MAITWIEQSRVPEKARGGIDVTVKLTDSNSGQILTKTIFFIEDPSTAQINLKCQKYADAWLFDLNPLNSFEPEGDDSKDIMATMTNAVRMNPLITEAELIVSIEKGHPDTLYKANKFINQSMIKSSCKTFDDFKIYLTNKKIIGIDDKTLNIIELVM